MSQRTLFSISEHTVKNDAEKYACEFQTPPHVAAYMASLIPGFARKILEPTPGEGILVEAIINHLDKVKGKDGGGYLVDAPDDFFLLKKQRFDAVLMNPPFSGKYANMENAPMEINKHGMRLGYYIMQQCMEMSDNIIALMPWFTISDSDTRLRFLKAYGLKSLTALPRVTFKYARIQTVVIELEKGWKQETIFKVYNKKK